MHMSHSSRLFSETIISGKYDEEQNNEEIDKTTDQGPTGVCLGALPFQAILPNKTCTQLEL